MLLCAGMGFSWNDWHLLRLVSESGISTFHQGRFKGIDSAMAALERIPDHKLPADACKASLKKVLGFVKDNIV
jgi:hypothetical protein